MNVDLLRHWMEDLIAYNKHLGVKLVSAEGGRARLEVPFRPEFVGDPQRPALHGGVLSALADAAGGAALLAGLADDRARLSTIDLRIDYLRPGRLETLVAEATIVRLGNRVGVADVRLFHPSAEAETIATGKGVYNVLLKKDEATRA